MLSLDPTELVVVVPTLDEEVHLERCLASVRSLNAHVVVVDAQSRDRTRDIATAGGATVVERAWTGYADQKNWVLDQIQDIAEWVLFLDADEYLTDGLAAEIRAKIADSRGAAGCYLARMNIFMGRELRHAWWYPDHQLRLFRVNAGRFEHREVHEHVVVHGRVDALENPLMHENLKGIDAFLSRHVRYARYEAAEFIAATRTEHRGSFFGSWSQRRRALKYHVWRRLKCRPAVRFLWMYVVRRGFLDGREGRVYCQLIAAYEAMIDAYALELEQQKPD